MFRALPFPLLVPLTMCAYVPSASAQAKADAAVHASGDQRAEELDQQGMALLKQGKLTEACPHFADSFRLRAGTGVLMRLALCQEQSGKWASAWHAYRDAAARAAASGDSAVVPLAQKRAAALEPRISRVILRVEPSLANAPGLEVTLDGNPLPPTATGVALEIDPGEHVVSASAPGRSPFTRTLHVADTAESHDLLISLPLQQATAIESQNPRSPVPEQQPPIHWSTQRKAAVISGGLGVVGVAVGAVFGLKVGSKMERARDRCGGSTVNCPSESLALQDQAEGAARISTVAFTVGVLGIAGGAALWFTAPNSTKREATAGLQLQPLISRNSGGVTMSGHW